MALTSLKRSDKDQKKTEVVCEQGERDPYPYGMRLDLDGDVVRKLKLTELPEVGTRVTLEARAVVISTLESQSSETDEQRRFTLQITDLELGPDEAEEADEGEMTRGGSDSLKRLAKRVQGL